MPNKGDIVSQAYVQMRISGITSKATPEDSLLGLQVLESMMLSWTNKGLNLGWQKSEDMINPDPQDDTGLADNAYEAAYLNLAVKLMPAFGKAPNDLLRQAQDAYSGLFSAELPTYKPNPYMPIGQGEICSVYDREFQKEEDAIQVGNDGDVDDVTI